MRILLLGGTAFLGYAIGVNALHRGHEVTCLARGSSTPPDGAAFVPAERDGENGMAAVVASTEWDVVIDVSGQPGQVRRAVRNLRCERWVFVSSGNVYADFSTIEQSEDSPLLALPDGEVMESMESYGAAKVACENVVRSGGSTATIVRSGLIGGPGDWSGRTGYWPWRFAHSTDTDVIVPDDLDFPCAIIDVRDLAAWVVTAAEVCLNGTFNATGLTVPLRDVFRVSARVAGREDLAIRPVAPTRLRELGVAGWMGPKSLPLWIDDPSWRGFATMDTTRARAAELTTRSLDETLFDTLNYENERDTPRQAGLTDDDERDIRRAIPT